MTMSERTIEKYLFALYVVQSPAFMGSVRHEATVLGKVEEGVHSRMLNTDILTESVLDELCSSSGKKPGIADILTLTSV